MSEIQNTKPLNDMLNSGAAEVLVWDGGEQRWVGQWNEQKAVGQRRRLDKLGIAIGGWGT